MNFSVRRLINTLIVTSVAGLSSCQLVSPEPKPSPITPSSSVIVPSSPSPQKEASVLDRVKTRGKLICGVNGKLPGFSLVNDKNEWSGLDVDFCRAIAAAVLGNAQSVEFKPVSLSQRFSALQNNEIDVLLRNTTWTLSRNTENSISFAPPIFYDGQGIMVKTTAKSNLPKPNSNATTKPDKSSESNDKPKLPKEELKELSGKTICVESGVNETNLKQALKEAEVTISPIIVKDTEAAFTSYNKDECEVISLEKSDLAARRSKLSKPNEHKILALTLSKEPFSPAMVGNDDRWHNVVTWVIYSTFYATELEINQKNYAIFKDTKNAEVAKFLGTSEALGIKLGLAPDWTTQVLKAVGNYDDIYTRNLEPLGLPRGQNTIWKEGGLLYAMPFR